MPWPGSNLQNGYRERHTGEPFSWKVTLVPATATLVHSEEEEGEGNGTYFIQLLWLSGIDVVHTDGTPLQTKARSSDARPLNSKSATLLRLTKEEEGSIKVAARQHKHAHQRVPREHAHRVPNEDRAHQ